MAYQTESSGDWPLGVYQIAVTDPVLGGSDGPPNLMGRALANRALYQRLRNVSPWSADLAATHGYPAKACVMHGGLSWRAVVDNNVAPGADALKWERWGYSEGELDAKLAALALQMAVDLGRTFVRFQGAVPPLVTVPSVAVPGTGVYVRLLLPKVINASADFVVDQANNTVTVVKPGLYMITSDCAANTVNTTNLINSQTVLRVNGVIDYLNRGVDVQGQPANSQWSNSIKGEVWLPAGAVIDVCGWNAPGCAATNQFIYDLMITRSVMAP
jgi:hypothetical protein